MYKTATETAMLLRNSWVNLANTPAEKAFLTELPQVLTDYRGEIDMSTPEFMNDGVLARAMYGEQLKRLNHTRAWNKWQEQRSVYNKLQNNLDFKASMLKLDAALAEAKTDTQIAKAKAKYLPKDLAQYGVTPNWELQPNPERYKFK